MPTTNRPNEGCVVGRGYLKRLEAERDTLRGEVERLGFEANEQKLVLGIYHELVDGLKAQRDTLRGALGCALEGCPHCSFDIGEMACQGANCAQRKALAQGGDE